MDPRPKRKATDDHPKEQGRDKRAKTKKQYLSDQQRDKTGGQAAAIHAGDAGIWATCPKGREGKCVAELKDLFDEYGKLLYNDTTPAQGLVADEDGIENAVQAEISELTAPSVRKQLFTPVRLDVQCVVFFKTLPPVEPVSLVQRICEDAAHGKLPVRARSVQRLTPMSIMGYASHEGVEKLAKQVLPSSFQADTPLKYAIRTNMRNHNTLKREQLIDQIAKLVGPSHPVDLKHYDLLVLVEAYKNVCGISIVTNAFDTLKRFNLAELTQIGSRSIAD